MHFSWDESMSTGMPRLDKQHQMLIQKFNEFTDILDDPNQFRETAADVLDFLQFYATWHFKQEEDCMDQYKCPIAAENRQAHEEFMVQFGNLYQRWQSGTMDVVTARKTHETLGIWIKNHIIETDTRLKPCLPKNHTGTLIG
jgi:hemerythrin